MHVSPLLIAVQTQSAFDWLWKLTNVGRA